MTQDSKDTPAHSAGAPARAVQVSAPIPGASDQCGLEDCRSYCGTGPRAGELAANHCCCSSWCHPVPGRVWATRKQKPHGINSSHHHLCWRPHRDPRWNHVSNQYDNDVTVWSPQSRIHHIEYAMEAVKQGSATVGLKSKTQAVLVALKIAQSELAAHQKKILHVDNHIGISIAGLTADARLLCNFMHQECLDSRFVFDRPLPVSCLVSLIGSKTQIPTQRYGRRPYGVGLLIASYDMGPHISQTCPSANYFDCRAMSIGARSQSARTYLEGHMSGFMECNLNELVKHGLRALRETLPTEQDLTTKNVSIGIVGKDLEFTIYDDDDVSPFLEGLEERPQRKAQPAQPADEPAEKADEPTEH
uniref:proteasome subunit alpha type-1-like n=1 Tax=Nyctereutes procyonoides TaxID=34880 RepID=UPI002444A1C2|nr:proteasome subunit alpha type-1-like [Nyctereutes procyonoides]